MGNRRMFSRSVIETDKFFDMNSKAQLIYFYLNLSADDDGFVGNIKKQLRALGGTPKQLDELVKNGYIIIFNTGVAVITHWHVHNTIRKDRYSETVYQEEYNKLTVDSKNVYRMATDGQPNGDKAEDSTATKVKLSEVKLSQYKKRESEERKPPTPAPGGEMNNVILTEEEYRRLKSEYTDIDTLIDRLSIYMASTGKSYASHYATLVRWAEADKEKQPPQKSESCSNSSYDIDEFFEMALRNSANRILDD